MNLANAGAFVSFAASPIASGGNISAIMTFWRMAMRVANPANTINTQATAVTNVERGVAEAASAIRSPFALAL